MYCPTLGQCNGGIALYRGHVIARVEVPDSCPDFKGRATSGLRPEVHSRAESLSLESLDMSRAVGRESLDMGRESPCPEFCDPCLDFRNQILVCQTFATHVQTFATNFWYARLSRPMSSFSRPNFGMSRLSRPTARLMSKLSRLKLSARLCNLGLNPDAARP